MYPTRLSVKIVLLYIDFYTCKGDSIDSAKVEELEI